MKNANIEPISKTNIFHFSEPTTENNKVHSYCFQLSQTGSLNYSIIVNGSSRNTLHRKFRVTSWHRSPGTTLRVA